MQFNLLIVDDEPVVCRTIQHLIEESNYHLQVVGSGYAALNSIKEHKPDLIGLGGLSTDYHFIRDALKIIRDKTPEIPVVLGGRIIENDEEFIFSTLRPDFSIIGEAEETIVNLINMLATGKQEYGEIANLSYWDKGTPIIARRDFNYIHLDERVFPDYEPFEGSPRTLEDCFKLSLYSFNEWHLRL